MIKLLTYSDEWSYHSKHKNEAACLSFIEREGYDTRKCMIEREHGSQIRVDEMIKLKNVPTGSPTAWRD